MLSSEMLLEECESVGDIFITIHFNRREKYHTVSTPTHHNYKAYRIFFFRHFHNIDNCLPIGHYKDEFITKSVCYIINYCNRYYFLFTNKQSEQACSKHNYLKALCFKAITFG